VISILEFESFDSERTLDGVTPNLSLRMADGARVQVLDTSFYHQAIPVQCPGTIGKLRANHQTHMEEQTFQLL
jgi:hypothetical protein